MGCHCNMVKTITQPQKKSVFTLRVAYAAFSYLCTITAFDATFHYETKQIYSVFKLCRYGATIHRW